MHQENCLSDSSDPFVVFGVKIIGNKETDGFGFFNLINDVYFIDIWSPKRNYNVPRFHTKHGVYCTMLTLERWRQSLEGYGYYMLDTVNLVNIRHIDHVIDHTHCIHAYFENGMFASVSRNKNNFELLAHLFRKED